MVMKLESWNSENFYQGGSVGRTSARNFENQLEGFFIKIRYFVVPTIFTTRELLSVKFLAVHKIVCDIGCDCARWGFEIWGHMLRKACFPIIIWYLIQRWGEGCLTSAAKPACILPPTCDRNGICMMFQKLVLVKNF